MDHVRIVVSPGDLSARVWAAYPMEEGTEPLCSSFSRNGLAARLRDLFPAGYAAHYHPAPPPDSPPRPSE